MLPSINNKIDIYLVIANNIKKYRKLKHITQKELALKSGYSYAFIRRLEAPKCQKYFSIQTICQIAKVLDIDISELFKE